jgi:hypothetical protein
MVWKSTITYLESYFYEVEVSNSKTIKRNVWSSRYTICSLSSFVNHLPSALIWYALIPDCWQRCRMLLISLLQWCWIAAIQPDGLMQDGIEVERRGLCLTDWTSEPVWSLKRRSDQVWQREHHIQSVFLICPVNIVSHRIISDFTFLMAAELAWHSNIWRHFLLINAPKN